MTVAIVGAGAMGGLWAAKLTAAGMPVAILETSQEVIDAVTGTGLVLQSAEGTETVRVRATTCAEEVGPVDVVFFFVKAHHTAMAADLAKPLVGPATTVVTLQNGWGNAAVLAATYPPERLVIGVTYHSATVLAPGRVAYTDPGPTFVGPYSDGAPLDRATAVRDLLTAAGFEVTLTPRIKAEIWKKLVMTAATLPTAALTRLRSGQQGQLGPLLDLVDALAVETVHVACAQGYDIDLHEQISHIHAVLVGPGKGSMLQDVEAGRKTEIDVINGAVVRAADHLGIDVPLNRTMVALIAGLERGWQH